MKRLFEQRLQLQLFFALLAATFVAALAVVFVSGAVRHAEGFVLSDTSKNLEQRLVNWTVSIGRDRRMTARGPRCPQPRKIFRCALFQRPC